MVIGFVVPLTETLINIHGILAGVGKSIRMTIRKWKIERGKSPENDLCPSQTDMNRESRETFIVGRLHLFIRRTAVIIVIVVFAEGF